MTQNWRRGDPERYAEKGHEPQTNLRFDCSLFLMVGWAEGRSRERSAASPANKRPPGDPNECSRVILTKPPHSLIITYIPPMPVRVLVVVSVGGLSDLQPP